MSSEIDIAVFRHVVSHFATGVVVVCSQDDGELIGFAAQSFVSLSLEPPLVLFCPQKTSTSWPRIRELGGFCINILSAGQSDISEAFAVSGEVPKIAWKPSPRSNTPVLDGALAYLDCELQDEFEGGDHTIAVSSVLELQVLESDQVNNPLLFFQGSYGRFTPTDTVLR